MSAGGMGGPGYQNQMAVDPQPGGYGPNQPVGQPGMPVGQQGGFNPQQRQDMWSQANQHFGNWGVPTFDNIANGRYNSNPPYDPGYAQRFGVPNAMLKNGVNPFGGSGYNPLTNVAPGNVAPDYVQGQGWTAHNSMNPGWRGMGSHDVNYQVDPRKQQAAENRHQMMSRYYGVTPDGARLQRDRENQRFWQQNGGKYRQYMQTSAGLQNGMGGFNDWLNSQQGA